MLVHHIVTFFLFPPSPKKKNRLYQFILPGWRKAKWESKVSCPPTQPSDAALVWTETRSSRVPLTSRASRHILRNCSRGRSSKPANFVRFGEIYVLLTMQTINIAISNCSFYAHTVMRWKCGEVRSKTLTNTFIKKIFSFQLNLIKKVSGLKIPWGILI